MTGATVGAALSGDVVRLQIAALPAHVRTARLVSGATARRAGLPEDDVEELKLAVGEAAGRAVALQRAADQSEPVTIEVSWNAASVTVTVADRGPGPDERGTVGGPGATAGADDDEAEAGRLALAVITGLVDDVTLNARDGGGTVVTMRWSLRRSNTPVTD